MSKRSILLLLVGLALLVLTACQPAVESSGVGDAAAAQPSEEPSLTAEPTAEQTAEPSATPTVEPSATATLEPTATATVELSATPTEEPTATPTESPTETPTVEPGIVRSYEIVPEESEARFLLDEVLFGNPKTVVGSTNQVSGTILLDLQNSQTAEVGPIQVDARSLMTDNEFRNRALQLQILNSREDAYQFVTFTPLEIIGLTTDPVVLDEPQTFEVTGDLRIRDIVQPATFVMTVTALSETELKGQGETTVLRSDFDLQIPSVPGVANVSEEVRLEIEFSARSAD